MRNALRLAVVGLSLLAMAGCGGTRLADARKITPTGDAFTVALANGYLEQSRRAYGGGDYAASDTWADMSMAAATGAPPAPTAVSEWDLPGDKVGELTDARARLMRAYDEGAKVEAPVAAAHAQVMLDCWMQKQAANTMPADITTCRSGFLNAMDDVDRALAGPGAPNSYMVFFDWNRADLTPEARAIVEDAAAAAKAGKVERIVVTGFADTTGKPSYNMKLSERRAGAVAEVLEANGIVAETISIRGLGEESPIVPSGDRVREPQNRRVLIELGMPAK